MTKASSRGLPKDPECKFTNPESFLFAGRDYLVATTQMINGNTLLEPIVQNRKRNTDLSKGTGKSHMYSNAADNQGSDMWWCPLLIIKYPYSPSFALSIAYYWLCSEVVCPWQQSPVLKHVDSCDVPDYDETFAIWHRYISSKFEWLRSHKTVLFSRYLYLHSSCKLVPFAAAVALVGACEPRKPNQSFSRLFRERYESAKSLIMSPMYQSSCLCSH